MNREEIDTLWYRAMDASIQAGEDFTRYHFAELVAEVEREACALLCEEMTAAWTEWQHNEGCMDCCRAIRARGGDA